MEQSHQIIDYVDGKRHGEYRSWHKDGVLHKQCTYNNGERDGEFKLWNEYSELLIHCFYKNGVRHGQYMRQQWGWNDNLFFQDNRDITFTVTELVTRIGDITPEEKIIIKLRFGINCI